MSLTAIQIYVAFVGLQLALIDSQKYLLPNDLTKKVFLAAVVAQIVDYRPQMMTACFFLIACHLIFAFVVPRMFGMGDAKFMAGLSLGLISSQSVWNWIFLAYFMGAIHGAYLKIRWKRSRIPFGVSLYGAWMLIIVGEWACVAMDYSWRIPR